MMMAKKTFTVENAHALEQAFLDAELAASESALRKAAVAGAREIHAEVKLRAPVAKPFEGRANGKHPPGFLRDHIIIAYDDEVSVPGRIAIHSSAIAE